MATQIGLIQAKYITFFAMIVGIATILICYGLSIRQGVVVPWLPMISDCFVYPPMSYISRLGMISTACLLWVIAFLYYTFLATDSLGGRKPSDSVALIFATIASLGLAIVGACNEDENGTLHGTGAILFFACEIIFMWISAVRLYKDQNANHNIKYQSIDVKFSLCCISTIMFVLFALMSGNWGKWGIEIAVSEWLGVFFILLFNASFAWEFADSEFGGAVMITPPQQKTIALKPDANGVYWINDSQIVFQPV